MKHYFPFFALAAASFTMSSCAESNAGTQSLQDQSATVYMTEEITPQSLVKIFEALGVDVPENARVAIKISTGESSRTNYLRPDFIAPLQAATGGRLVECNTAYGGSRSTTADHRKAIEERGYADVDIMDEEGTLHLPVVDTTWIKYDIVGSHLQNYDFFINLAHFKGHQMGGFGGVLKNQSIGVASSTGKAYIHSAGVTDDVVETWSHTGNQDGFLESMAAAAQAVHNYFKQDGKNIVYINVMNNMSIDCDCNAHPATPQLKDMGILASTDPVALDKACLDLVFGHQSTAGDNADPLIRRIEQMHGTHTVEYAEHLGLGTQSYRLVNIDGNTTGVDNAAANAERYNVFTVDGKKVLTNATSLESLAPGTYIINGQKKTVQ